MPPLSHRLVALSASCLKAEAPLLSRTPIGRISEANRPISTSPIKQSIHQRTASSWSRSRQYAAARQWEGSVRRKYTWQRPSSIATSPQRSDTTPLLGVVVGVTTLAYLGAALVQQDDQQQESPIKGIEGVDNEDDEEGKYD